MATLPREFSDFKATQEQVFNVRGAGQLDIDASCPIAILPCDNGKVEVAIDAAADDLKDFEVSHNGDKVSLKQKGMAGGSTVVMGGGSVVIGGSSRGVTVVSNIRGGSVSIINGRVIVDGKEIKPDGKQSSEPTRLPRVVIKAPVNSNVDAEIGGAALLFSSVAHDEVYLRLAGQTNATVTAKTLNVDASGQSSVKATVNGGDLDVDLSGQGRVETQGEFAKVKADLSGMGQIRTSGTVRGNYTADASGMGSIVHRGDVRGRVRESKSGMATIEIG